MNVQIKIVIFIIAVVLSTKTGFTEQVVTTGKIQLLSELLAYDSIGGPVLNNEQLGRGVVIRCSEFMFNKRCKKIVWIEMDDIMPSPNLKLHGYGFVDLKLPIGAGIESMVEQHYPYLSDDKIQHRTEIKVVSASIVKARLASSYHSITCSGSEIYKGKIRECPGLVVATAEVTLGNIFGLIEAAVSAGLYDWYSVPYQAIAGDTKEDVLREQESNKQHLVNALMHMFNPSTSDQFNYYLGSQEYKQLLSVLDRSSYFKDYFVSH